MKSLKMVVWILVVSVSFFVSFASGGEYFFGPGDDLIKIDTKENANDGNIELSRVIYLTQQDVSLAKEFVRECVREFPKDCPFRAELKGLLKDLNNPKVTPDVELILSLRDAQLDSSKVCLPCTMN